MNEEWQRFVKTSREKLAVIEEGIGDFDTLDSTTGDVVEWVEVAARELAVACKEVQEHIR